MIYRSNLHCPDLTPQFPRLISEPLPHTLGHDALREEFTVEEVGSEELARNYSLNGFLTHDEVAILYHIARNCRVFGKNVDYQWLDIGGAMGWSAMHIYEAGCGVVSLDKMYDHLPFLERRLANFQSQSWTGGTSSATLEGFAQTPKIWGQFVGALIDGCHAGVIPITDTAQCVMLGIPIIVFHDFMGDTPVEAAKWLIDYLGWSCRIYLTPHGMAVCWDSTRLPEFQPPVHQPDPNIDWKSVLECRRRQYLWTMAYEEPVNP
jgi:hypothetical protein